MPIYEYICINCNKKISIYFPTSCQDTASCPECKSKDLKRVLSAFTINKTDKDVYEDILTDSNLTKGMLNNDPRALAEWNKRMTGGEKVTPEYEDMVGKMEKGEIPAEMMGQRKKKPENDD